VLRTGTRRFALWVDTIRDAQEIVVKPLGRLLSGQTEYSGAALLGDGTIALILDVLGIARSCGLVTAEQSMQNDSIMKSVESDELEQQVLVCEIDGARRIALPLADVVCLEHIPRTAIEPSATGQVVQYRGGILSLYSLSKAQPLPQPGAADTEHLSVVIYRTAETELGLLVDSIVDIAPRPAELHPVEPAATDRRERVIATAVVLDRITDLLQVT
jgi:two-component system chemotaxis sensor kinase CheA